MPQHLRVRGRLILFSLVWAFVPLLALRSVTADIRLPKIFSDKMVLQHGNSVTIWGKADPGETLGITLGEQSATTNVDADGNWVVQIKPPEIGGPYELVVAGAEARVVLKEVMVGEVWICSGQSNMEWSIRQSVEFPDTDQRDAYLAALDNPNIRLFTVPRNAIEERAYDFSEAVVWEECRGESAANFSATAYFFAVALQKFERFKDVPIGLVDSSWGGTPIEAWTPLDAMKERDELAPLLEHWKENPEGKDSSRPANLFNGMIAPLIPYTVRGVIWYQGEANVGRAEQYETLFETMILDWRKKFSQGDIPFYYVQLAPFRYNADARALPELWDAQRKIMRIANTGMAGSSDIGNLKDIHPRNKQIVGERLARIAMAETYLKEGLVPMGPVFKAFEVLKGSGSIRLEFKFADGLKAGEGPLSGFQICGEDGQFQNAVAKIDGNRVIVQSAQVANPVHVRYLWDHASKATLFNGDGLPAVPFRTDNFELLSKGKNF